MRDIDRFHAADRCLKSERTRETARSRHRILHKSRRLGLPLEFPVVITTVARLALVKLLDGLDLIAQHRRALKLKRLTCGVHLFAHLAQHRASLRSEETHEAIDVGAIFLFRNARGAGCGALVDRSKQTRPKEAILRIAVHDFQFAGAVLEDALQKLHRVTQAADGDKRAVDTCSAKSIVARIARDVDARKVVAQRHREIGKRFVVLQPIIERRMDVLDEARLHQERFPLAFAGNEVEVDDDVEHRLLAEPEVGGRDEVTRDAVWEDRSFPYIKDAAACILHQIHTGHIGQRPRFPKKSPDALLARFPPRRRRKLVARRACTTIGPVESIGVG